MILYLSDEVNLTTQVKVAQLPQTVTAHLKNTSIIHVPVTWDAIDPARYDSEGNSFTVAGTVVSYTTLKNKSEYCSKQESCWIRSLHWLHGTKFDEANGTSISDASVTVMMERRKDRWLGRLVDIRMVL